MKNDLIEKQDLRRKEFQYYVGQTFFIKSSQDLQFSLCFDRVVGRSLLPEGGLSRDIDYIYIHIGDFNLSRFEGHSILCDNKVTTFSMAGISYQNHCMAGIQCGSAQKAGIGSLCSETLAGISTLAQ